MFNGDIAGVCCNYRSHLSTIAAVEGLDLRGWYTVRVGARKDPDQRFVIRGSDPDHIPRLRESGHELTISTNEEALRKELMGALLSQQNSPCALEHKDVAHEAVRFPPKISLVIENFELRRSVFEEVLRSH